VSSQAKLLKLLIEERELIAEVRQNITDLQIQTSSQRLHRIIDKCIQSSKKK
jgi:hypothetical protein